MKDKKILVTGSEGLIGRELVEQLEKLGAIVTKADLKLGHNLIHYRVCLALCDGMDYVFHLAGIKGNPKRTKERPVDFMGPMLQFDTNMILAAHEKGVKNFLYTSSIAVTNPENDYYPAWAKSTAEKLIEAMRIQYPNETNYCIVRPANVYGRYDNFSNPDAMVVTKLINLAKKEGKLILDKKGSMQERDFINAKDVARGMIQIMNDMPKAPINLCSGKGKQINQVACIIRDILGIKLEYVDLDIVLGPDRKVMQINYPFIPTINLEDGIKEAIEYYGK